MDYADTLRRHRRLTILRGLAAMPAYSTNESIVAAICDEYRVTSTRDQVRTELGWLQEQGLVSNQVVGDLIISTITQGGLDIAAGKRVHADIEKPAPRRA